MHPSLRAFQRHQEHYLKQLGSVELITTKQNKTNHLPSQMDVQALILSTLGKKKGKKQFFFLKSFCFFLFLLFFCKEDVFHPFSPFFSSILSGSFPCSVFHLCFFFPQEALVLLFCLFFSTFSQFFLFIIIIFLLFFSSLSIFPRQMYFIVPSFSFLSLPFQFSSFFHMVCFFCPFFFLFGAYGHPP